MGRLSDILGWKIERSAPRVVTAGTNFEALSIANAVKAQAPRTPDFRPPPELYGAPPAAFTTQSQVISRSLNERTVWSDPRDLWYLSLPNKLTPQQVLNILRSALAGDNWQQWMLYSLMLDTWPTFRMAVHQLREAIAYAKFTFHPYVNKQGEKPSKKAVEKAELCARAMAGYTPNDFTDEKGFSGMVYDWTDSIFNGISVTETLWEKRITPQYGLEWLPRASVWVHPRHLMFGQDGTLCVFSDDTSRSQADPRQFGVTFQPQPPNLDKFVCASFSSRSGSPLGGGLMRPLALLWCGRQFNQEWMLQSAKKYGSPFLNATYSDVADKEALEQFCENAGHQRWVVHKEGTTVELEPPAALGKENPQRYLTEESDRQCLFLILGQTGTTSPTPGKLGNSDTQMEVKQERVEGGAQFIARNPVRSWARALLRVNYGRNGDDECPTPLPDFTKPLDATEAGTLAVSMSNSQMPVRADELFKKTGFSVPEPGDLVVKGGELVIMSEPMSEEERAQNEFDGQLEMMEAQAEIGAKNQPPAKANDKGTPVPIVVKARRRLATMSEAELDELENKVRAAEKAKHANGEWNEVKRLL